MVSPLDEHHGYLSLAGRSELYDRAIGAVLRPGDTVADLGCGVGVLGLQCLDAGAAHVYGIDYSDAIELTRETVARAGLEDRYSCLRESTFRVELPERVDVVICDHIGYFGFDYGIGEMMADARRRLLKPGGAMIPRSIDLIMAGVSSDGCRKLAQGWTGETFREEYHWLNSYARNAKHPWLFKPEELCSQPVRMGTIRLDSDNSDHFAMTATLEVERDCRFDGLAGWFDCELAEGVRMTNSPLSPEAIERNNVFLPCNEPFDAAAGDLIEVDLRFRDDGEMIAWSVTPANGGAKQSMSTWKSKILTQADMVADSAKPLSLNRIGEARKAVLKLVDGKRTAAEIEEAVLADHADLFPTAEEWRRFLRHELGNCVKW
ncbi:methyltransferase domain-containing protein [Alteraurantiacibacter aquimixticola]|uniref:Methyltransferase domain-containing protein n=1 Tax=Alteraurantiacibacter aquimixticola TaxID=2489173 RepID=A0A4T3EWN2_9SPHN|nr:50S ribosomal protein L11 methyltransferase [Alteraurantiacibacter aquimixticola]TIX48966.1 methyltransferase domain-containing protein [Alteraurantiacibacter aquimixticola]